MVSSGTDNCIKMWVFDSPDGTARLLRSREGHRAPPRAIRYYGNTTLATMGEGAGEHLMIVCRRVPVFVLGARDRVGLSHLAVARNCHS